VEKREHFKKAEIDDFDYDQLKPGEWGLARPRFNGKLTVYICTPGGYFGSLRNHTISDNGEVNPSVLIIRGDKEVYHAWVVLDGWDSNAASTALGKEE